MYYSPGIKHWFVFVGLVEKQHPLNKHASSSIPGYPQLALLLGAMLQFLPKKSIEFKSIEMV